MKIHKTKLLLFFILLTSMLTIPLDCVTILVHGSFAANTSWYTHQGKFFQTLEEQASKLNQKVVSFTWSGKPTIVNIVRGAEDLAKLIASYPPEEEIILIGHSHGGNVINFASRLLNDHVEEIMEQQSIEEGFAEIFNILNKILTETETKEENQNSKNQKRTITQKQTLFSNLKPRKSSFVNTDPKTVSPSQKIAIYQKCKSDIKNSIKKTIEKINNLNNNKLNLKNQSKKHLISKVFLLGTPVDMDLYAPCMRIIKNLYNFYSIGDSIQTVLGLYQQTYPQTDGITNLRILIKNCGYFSHNPGHTQLHDVVIAKWILRIPDIFENFDPDNYGEIFFDDESNPLYKVHAPLVTTTQDLDTQELFIDNPFAEQIDTTPIRVN